MTGSADPGARGMTIGEVARRSGVPAKTIRYYESVGLIAGAERRRNNYRDYDESDVRTLHFVRRARSLGFTMRDVADLLALWNDRSRASADVKAVALRHLSQIDAKIAQLSAMRDTLEDLSRRCHGDDRPDCPILDELAADRG